MSSRTQRYDEIEAMIDAISVGSPPDEDGQAAAARLTGLEGEELEAFAAQVIVAAFERNGGNVVKTAYTALVLGLELGHRLGLEEAGNLPAGVAEP